MIILIKKIIDVLAIFCSFFYNYKLVYKWKFVQDLFYTHFVCSGFRSVGKNPFIMRKIKLLGGKNIIVGDNFYCYWGVRIETYSKHNGIKFNPQIIIGNNVGINPDCHIGCIEKIIIGDNVLLASRVFITDHFHGKTDSQEALKIPPPLRKLYSKGAVIIESNVWIGEGVCIMPGVTIGKGSVIGANSVVTKNIPPYSIVGGIPAKIIKQF